VPIFHRYLDIDGDGICARTLPGTHPKGAYFARGSGHDRFGGYTEDADEYTDVVDRIARKIESARAAVPAAQVEETPGAGIGIVALGSADAAVREALEQLAAAGAPANYLRVRAFPFGAEVDAFLMRHSVNFVIDMNRDAQLRSLLALETTVPKERLRSVRYYGGMPLSAHHVVEGILRQL
jgi:2-oxoglutarate/2-oxoacid ferredoxin oxidoreductase subunit alpha